MSTEQEHQETCKTIVGHVESEFVVSLEEDGLNYESDLMAAGIIDSFGIVNLITILETEFGVRFNPKDMLSEKLASIAGLAEVVMEKKQAS